MALGNAYWVWGCAVLSLVSLRRHNIVTLGCLVLLFFGIGWWRGSEYMQKLTLHQSLHLQKVTLIGRATEDAVYGKRSQLEFSLSNSMVIRPKTAQLVGDLTVRGFGTPMVYRGDIVRVTGKLYPTRGNNLASISFAKLELVAQGKSWIDELRRRFAAGLQSALPEPAASFGLGLLVGQRSTLPEETSDQLRHVGLTHIIAVSGYNVTIIVIACRRLLAKRSKFQATALCVACLVIFLLMTGSSPPIVRASIISMLSIWAWYYGRSIPALVLLLVGAGISALANPLYVWGNVSWYLSFLAFFGVLVVAPLAVKRIYGSREPRLVAGICIETICASLLVAPYALHTFGQVSLVSLVANVLVVPLIPLAMLLALVAGLAGMIVPAIAGWLAWPANWLLTYMLDVANLFDRTPHGFIDRVEFSLPMMIASYLLLAAVCWLLWYKTSSSRLGVANYPLGGIITDSIQSKSKEQM